MGNSVVPLLVIAGSGAAVYAGITNPEGGVFAGLGALVRGEAVTKASTNGTGFLSTAADLAAVVGGRAAGTGGSTTLPTVAGSTPANVGAKRTAVIAAARTWLGVPYKWAGTTAAGVDCSGLTLRVFATVGISLPHLSAAQQGRGVRRTLATALPGDLVFFGVPAHHVGIYIGGNQIIHAPHPGTVVRVETIWTGEVITVRDVLSPKHKRKHKRATVAT